MLPLYSIQLPLLFGMTPEQSDVFVPNWHEFKKFRRVGKMNSFFHNHSPTAFSASELLSLPRCS
jgi:hypothetical protein